MGIPKFVKDFIFQYKDDVIKRDLNGRIATLALDFNSLMHAAAEEVYAYGKHANLMRQKVLRKEKAEDLQNALFAKITSILLSIVHDVKPEETLILAIDGAVPLAKQFQQRQRRYRSANERNTTEEKEVKPLFDSNVITPGTPFMAAFDKYFKKWLEENHDNLPPKIIYSSYRQEGEGEHIIMDYFRKVNDNKNHVIYGLDADLIVLSLLLPTKYIYLYRTRKDDIVDINALRQVVTKLMSNTARALDDFVIITFLLGNDFLPASPAMAMKAYSIKMMTEVYKALQKKAEKLGLKEVTLTKNDRLNFDGLSHFFNLLAINESDMIIFLYENMGTFKSPSLDPDYDKFEEKWYQQIFAPRDEKLMAKIDMYVYGSKRPSYTAEDIGAMAAAYITMMEWTYLYYRQGMKAVDVNYYYPYHYAPTLKHLYQIVDAFTKGETDVVLAPEYKQQMGIFHQLLNVLPPATLQAIYDQGVEISGLKSPTYLNNFPVEIKVDDNGIPATEKHLWIALVPKIYHPQIQEYVHNIIDDITDFHLKPYLEEKDVVLTRSGDYPVKYDHLFKVEPKSYISRPRFEHSSTRGRGSAFRGRGQARGRGGRK